jgi:hypothetical protein
MGHPGTCKPVISNVVADCVTVMYEGPYQGKGIRGFFSMERVSGINTVKWYYHSTYRFFTRNYGTGNSVPLGTFVQLAIVVVAPLISYYVPLFAVIFWPFAVILKPALEVVHSLE